MLCEIPFLCWHGDSAYVKHEDRPQASQDEKIAVRFIKRRPSVKRMGSVKRYISPAASWGRITALLHDYSANRRFDPFRRTFRLALFSVITFCLSVSEKPRAVLLSQKSVLHRTSCPLSSWFHIHNQSLPGNHKLPPMQQMVPLERRTGLIRWIYFINEITFVVMGDHTFRDIPEDCFSYYTVSQS